MLLANGADANLGDPDGISPMVLAIRNGHFDVAELLVEQGANVNAADGAGRTALYAAVDMHTLDRIQYRPAPRPSGQLDGVDLVKPLLERGADPNAPLRNAPPGWKGDAVAAGNSFAGVIGPGTTPFIRAAKNLDFPVIRLLLAKGANPNLTTRTLTTALMAAAAASAWRYGADLKVSPEEEKTAIEVITLCLERGADVNAASNTGQTALHGAALIGTNAVVRFLVERGAKLDAKTTAGRTPLDEALRGVTNADGAAGEANDGTAALLRELMTKRGITVPADKPAAGAN